MLVLNRRSQEYVNVFIGGRLLGRVYYLGQDPERVSVSRLGFDFGEEISIERAEITERRLKQEMEKRNGN